MATINKPNIFSEYCPSVLIQGKKCSAKQKGKKCNRAHKRDEIFPEKCMREGGMLGCSHRYDKTPLICKFIHDGETKQEFTDRLGFDPENIKYNNYTSTQICDTISDLKKNIKKLKYRNSTLGEEFSNQKYIQRNNKAIDQLKTKKKFLNDLVYEKTWLRPNLRWAVLFCVRKARITMEQQGDNTVCELLRRLSTVPSAYNSTPHTEGQVLRHILEYVGKGIVCEVSN